MMSQSKQFDSSSCDENTQQITQQLYSLSQHSVRSAERRRRECVELLKPGSKVKPEGGVKARRLTR